MRAVDGRRIADAGRRIKALPSGTEEEFDVVVVYLVAQYGRVAVDTAPAGEMRHALETLPDAIVF